MGIHPLYVKWLHRYSLQTWTDDLSCRIRTRLNRDNFDASTVSIPGRLITVPHYGLVNLVAGTQIATELMQTDLTAEKLAHDLIDLLDPKRNENERKELRRVRNLLGEAGASERAAELILKALN